MRNWVSKFVDTESIGILHHQREPQGMQVCARVRPCADGEASEITAKQIEARLMTVMNGETAWEWEHRSTNPMRGVRKDLCIGDIA